MHDERERKILDFWNKEKIFQKSLQKDAPKGDFVFYDGPPFATGTPHYGHILAGTIKDVIPRYKTMRGYRVRRRWGWDCHGLPVENLVEKELGLSSKKDILSYGIDKFNKVSRESVMRFADEWRRIVPRVGRWVDMDHDYRTMDAGYTESVWWAFKKLHDKGLIYEGSKSMHICPHCETTLSNFEVAQGYKDITDLSVYVKCELVDTPGTYLIAWTTTPWTLPGNAAIAVNKNVDYVVFTTQSDSTGKYIVAEARLDALKSVAKQELSVVGKMAGAELVGRAYKSIFPYYATFEKKIYAGDFVTTEDGTGVVHIAPAFGSDDYELSKKYKIPFIQHVGIDGRFRPEVVDFVGKSVKPKDDHQAGDVEIIKYLAGRGLLFAKEKTIHPYPHCWRCETPLLNYATSSWFVRVTDFKDKLVSENRKITWVPEEIGTNRFGDWLGNARDWAISRARFWGAPIPVWKNEKTGEAVVIGSVADLKKYSKSKNRYIVMRHGEAENNVRHIVSSLPDAPHHLTEDGKRQVRESVEKISVLTKGGGVDLIYTSSFVRTRETADMVAQALGVKGDDIKTDERIREINGGDWNSKPASDFHNFFKGSDRFTKRPAQGENYSDVRKRVGQFIYDLEGKHEGKTILVVTHDTPAWLLFAAAYGTDETGANILRGTDEFFIKNAEVKELDFSPIPHDENFELDLHRPYIDEVVLTAPDGGKLARVPEVFDCWFESGSMPYAEAHYPFDKSDKSGAGDTGDFDPSTGSVNRLLSSITGGAIGGGKGYPADFIAEGLDQTRGWFYSMLVLGVALFGRAPYKRVIVNGLVLGEDGQKMSKSKKNYSDPSDVVSKYGADALRYYLLASPLMRGQDFCFSEKGVDEVVKKHIGRLLNVLAFYEMFASDLPTGADTGTGKNILKNPLDRWVVARLSELTRAVTAGLESYELDVASRPFADFIDDLSTWYIRRSRDRFKGDDKTDMDMAISTTRYVLSTLAKLLAPFMPFLAEEIYGRIYSRVGGVSDSHTSVHLSDWPEPIAVEDEEILALMKEVRKITSFALEARSKSKINVRQPLGTLKVREDEDNRLIKEYPGLSDLIKDEVNVSEVTFVSDMAEEVLLDTNITPALREAGRVREVIRAIQDARKESGLSQRDHGTAEMVVATEEDRGVVNKNKDQIMRATGLSALELISGDTDSLSIKVKKK